MIYDKNYETIRHNDKVNLNCDLCECLNKNGIIKCTATYENNELALRDSDDNEYRFEIDENGKANQLNCIEVIVRADDETEYLI